MLRKQIIQQLEAMPSAERAAIENALTDHLVSSDLWQQSNVIGVTMSRGIEWCTEPIIRTAWKEGKTVAVPKSYPSDRSLAFFIMHHYNQLETAHYRLLEPIPEQTEKLTKQAIDLLIVPGMVFDRKGYRIGFGGGYYDRFLSDFPNYKLALAANMQLIDELPAESFDRPVDAIITETGFLSQGSGLNSQDLS
ncbi:5-formyltetrahydrofolate cyclo-ligase [Barrientosiimonas marina]|uniref:5-formyltetrahydrofolate cyclo-ligase n=1 Tax=Lentibacillus kimchii TaxID=1542911 RepID=A0ABW2UYD2_9BACI